MPFDFELKEKVESAYDRFSRDQFVTDEILANNIISNVMF